MFSDNLKTMRKAKGYTQEELAIKLNVVRQTVSKWEKGLSVPDADVLSKIADVLDTKVDILLVIFRIVLFKSYSDNCSTTVIEMNEEDVVYEE